MNFTELLFRFAKVSISPKRFGSNLAGFYSSKSSSLQRGFMDRIAGDYSPEEIAAIRSEVYSLILFAHEAAVRQYTKPKFHTMILDGLKLYLSLTELENYRQSKDIGMTFMERCGFKRNAYIYQFGTTIFNAVKNLVKETVKKYRIEEGGG